MLQYIMQIKYITYTCTMYIEAHMYMYMYMPSITLLIKILTELIINYNYHIRCFIKKRFIVYVVS